MPISTDPAQGSLPEILQARLRQGLRNWAKRTLLWSAFLAIFSVHFPTLKVILAFWIVFSVLHLAMILAGMKLARNLTGGGTTVSFGMGGGPVHSGAFGQAGPFAGSGDVSTPQASPDDPPPRAKDDRQGAGEVIEIDAEVLPPDTPAPHRQPKPREIHEG